MRKRQEGTPEEQQELAAWPDGGRLFQHLRELPGPLRLAGDLSGAAMRHRGGDVGNFFLAEKEGGEEFTDDDEEVLMLFASQAAAAIANARTHRNEQRARADLEALVETSPIGVVDLDAQTGQPTRFNREARRIGEGLRIPGRPPEQALEVMACRRADGREASLSWSTRPRSAQPAARSNRWW